MKKYRAAVIGCGQIGAGYDDGDSESVLNHARAYDSHSSMSLVAVMDKDPSRARFIAERYDSKPYDNFEELLKEQSPDIITISVPTEFHYAYLLTALKFNPAAVIAEKPLSDSLERSEEILNLYAKKEIPLFVNFMRRYDLTMIKFRQDLLSGKFGKILNASFRYAKGILHNGSHALDLAHYLFGKAEDCSVLGAVNDFDKNDLSLSVFIRYERCPSVFFIAGDERCFSMFEVDVLTEKKRFIFEESGLKLREYEAREHENLLGYKFLNQIERKNTNLKTSLLALMDNVVNHIEKRKPIISSGADAFEAQKLGAELLTLGLRLLK